MSLAPKLAFRNLIHDRLRLIATVIGIVFSIVLVTIQMGLYVSFERMVTVMIDHADADLWIVPRGTKCFEDPSLLDERERFRALSVNGVAAAAPLVIGFAQWRTPSGGNTPIFMIGSDPRGVGLQPWNVVDGKAANLHCRRGRHRPLLFRSSGDDPCWRLRRDRRPEGAGGGDHRRHPLVHHHALRVRVDRPRPRLYRHAANKASYFLVRVAPGANVDGGARRACAQLPDIEVLTPPNSATEAASSGCSAPVPAPRCSRARCSA